jgi:hypothetical protein
MSRCLKELTGPIDASNRCPAGEAHCIYIRTSTLASMPSLVPLLGSTKEVQSVLGHTLGTYARFGPYFLRLVAKSG